MCGSFFWLQVFMWLLCDYSVQPFRTAMLQYALVCMNVFLLHLYPCVAKYEMAGVLVTGLLLLLQARTSNPLEGQRQTSVYLRLLPLPVPSSIQCLQKSAGPRTMDIWSSSSWTCHTPSFCFFSPTPHFSQTCLDQRCYRWFWIFFSLTLVTNFDCQLDYICNQWKPKLLGAPGKDFTN